MVLVKLLANKFGIVRKILRELIRLLKRARGGCSTGKNIGVATSIGCESTARNAHELGYNVVGAGAEARVDWRIKVVGEGQTVVRMKALTDEESDALELSLPVNPPGVKLAPPSVDFFPTMACFPVGTRLKRSWPGRSV